MESIQLRKKKKSKMQKGKIANRQTNHGKQSVTHTVNWQDGGSCRLTVNTHGRAS